MTSRSLDLPTSPFCCPLMVPVFCKADTSQQGCSEERYIGSTSRLSHLPNLNTVGENPASSLSTARLRRFIPEGQTQVHPTLVAGPSPGETSTVRVLFLLLPLSLNCSGLQPELAGNFVCFFIYLYFLFVLFFSFWQLPLPLLIWNSLRTSAWQSSHLACLAPSTAQRGPRGPSIDDNKAICAMAPVS